MNLKLKINNTSLKHLLINNHDVAANKEKFKGHLPLDYIFGLCKIYKKITKQSGFHLTFKTAFLQHNIHTTIGDDIKLNFDKLFLFVPIIIPDASTQIMFNDSIKNSFTLSFDSWSTDRKTVDTQLEYQVDIGSAQTINSSKYLIVAHQTADRIAVPHKANNVAVFDNLNVRKYHVDIDVVCYPREGVNIDYELTDYVDQSHADGVFVSFERTGIIKISDIDLANKKYFDDELDKNTVLRFNQTLQNYLKVSVGNDVYNLTKYDRIQITDRTVIKYPNSEDIYCKNGI